jgi:pimeloyl-ACP methyl ester carboxylesterase
MNWLAPLGRSFTVYYINRRFGLAHGTTTAGLAADYARALAELFDGSVDILGASTGGHSALQLAIAYPQLVRKLVLVATAYRMGPAGMEASRRSAELAEVGKVWQSQAAMAPALTGNKFEQKLFKALYLLATPLILEHNWNPSDLIATLRADLAFDVGDRLHEIQASTLMLAGIHDPSYPLELAKATVERIPHARLIVYPRSHSSMFTERRFAQDIVNFLTEQ